MINTDSRVAQRSPSKLSCMAMFNSLCGNILFVVLLFVERYLSDSRQLVQGYRRHLEGNQNTVNWSLKEVRRKESFLGVSSCWKCVGRCIVCVHACVHACVCMKWEKPKQLKPSISLRLHNETSRCLLRSPINTSGPFLIDCHVRFEAGLRWRVLWQMRGRTLW